MSYINQKFSKFTVLYEHSNERTKFTRYICECQCQRLVTVPENKLSTLDERSCSCQDNILTESWWKDRVIRGASSKKGRSPIDIKVDRDFAWQLFLEQNKRCALTGVKLNFPRDWYDRSGDASFDRKDSSKGYVEGNVWWIHKDVNMMKNSLNLDYFKRLCGRIK